MTKGLCNSWAISHELNNLQLFRVLHLFYFFRVTEDDRLSTILNKFLYPEYCPPELKDHLQYYQSVGYTGVTVLMKAENIKKSKERYYHLDVGESLKENLEGKTIIEFPTIHVIFNHNRNMYNIIDTGKL